MGGGDKIVRFYPVYDLHSILNGSTLYLKMVSLGLQNSISSFMEADI